MSKSDHELPWQDRFDANADWLVKLRWVAIVGQLLTIGSVWLVLGIPLPLMSLLGVLAITAISNVAFAAWVYFRRRTDRFKRESQLFSLVMALDMVMLTALLYLTGGPTNPFAVFYFVNLSLCGFLLNRGSAWALNGLAILSFASILFAHRDLPVLESREALAPISQSGEISLLQWGLLLAFVACGSVIVHFTSRLHEEVRSQEAELRAAEGQRAQSEKLQALGTLAAGAAHELATPLSTIAVVAREFEHQLSRAQVDPAWQEDVELIRSEVDRCRKILDRMSTDAGQSVGESIRLTTGQQLVDEILAGLANSDRIKASLSEEAASASMSIPLTGAAQAIRGMVSNAIDASPEGVSVLLEAMVEEDQFVIMVRDRGEGMSPDILRRLSEPFFTTKEPGQGMGLGVFLARTTIEGLGGSIQVKSIERQGTRVDIKLPIASRPT